MENLNEGSGFTEDGDGDTKITFETGTTDNDEIDFLLLVHSV